jgi:hypothetical protein
VGTRLEVEERQSRGLDTGKTISPGVAEIVAIWCLEVCCAGAVPEGDAVWLSR